MSSRSLVTGVLSRCRIGAIPLTLLAWFMVIAIPGNSRAITINISYSDEGSPLPHPENPSWDPAGTILKSHFAAAKQIWEDLLPGPGSYEFDFQWDDDIGPALGLTTDAGPLDLYIELNSTSTWYADPFPLTDNEFSAGVQKLYSGLSSIEQSTYFPGTTPPIGLEVSYRGNGILNGTLVNGLPVNTLSASGQNLPGTSTPVDSSNGFDLLSVILHEIGHVLGVAGTEPGEYNIYPQHVGGLNNVLVQEHPDSGHLGGNSATPGFLMNPGTPPGQRVFATATDVLVIAEDQGIIDVHLARVDSITGGQWHTASNWIGADVPDLSQSAYIQHGGTVSLGADAVAKDVIVGSNSNLIIGDRILSSTGIFNFAGSSIVSIDAGGILYANQIVRGANDLMTAVGSRVEFNSYAGGDGVPVTFGGSVGIGTGSSPPPEITFNPASLPTWTIGGELAVGAARSAHFVIDTEMGVGTDVTSATGLLGYGSLDGPAGRVTVSGAGSSWVVSGGLRVSHGSLNVSNSGQVQSASADIGTSSGIGNVDINGGIWDVTGNIEIGPNLAGSPGGGQVNIRNLGSLRADGDLVLRGTPTRSGDITLYSRGNLEVDGTVTVHPYTKVTLRDDSYLHSGALGSETIENLGGNNSDPEGGIIQFLDSSTSGNAHITNRPGNAQFARGGETRFYNTSKAGSLLTSGKTRIDNFPGPASIFGGATRFFNQSNGGDSDFYNHPGPNYYALIEFNDDSSGGFGTYTNLAGGSGVGSGGTIVFNDRAKAGGGVYQSLGEGGVVVFYENSSAENGTFTTADNIGGNSRIQFFGNSTAADANFSMGYSTPLQFYDYSTAADADITIRQGGYVQFAGTFMADYSATTTAADADIILQGGSVVGVYGGHAGFSTWSTAGNATITAHGGTVLGAGGADIAFDYTAHAGNATLIAHGGTNGGQGAQIYFRRGATGDTSRIVLNPGSLLDTTGNRIYGGTSIGSLEGAGLVQIGGDTSLTVGTNNLNTTFSGIMTEGSGQGPNGQFTKVGNGTLSLDGANTYTGLTTVAAGTLAINGSVAGNVVVNAGATLAGAGTIAGTTTVADGGILAPGNSPGTLRTGSLTLNPNSVLNMEFGVVSDLLIVTGDLTLDGVLNILPGVGFSAFGKEIFNYTGTLTNNGLTIGSVPAGFSPSDFVLDFSTPGEINFIGPTETVPGDYNYNGVVDAADYTVWRNNLGSGTSLPNDDTPGVGPDDYTRWKTNYGQTAGIGSGAGMTATVPEPTTFVLLMLVTIGWCVRRGPASSKSQPLFHA